MSQKWDTEACYGTPYPENLGTAFPFGAVRTPVHGRAMPAQPAEVGCRAGDRRRGDR
ncbi:MAG: hypothetical protein HGA19_09090 [Oscillochloris sp.]|nr:hypothetical protein [Oscillochloris sp.]